MKDWSIIDLAGKWIWVLFGASLSWTWILKDRTCDVLFIFFVSTTWPQCFHSNNTVSWRRSWLFDDEIAPSCCSLATSWRLNHRGCVGWVIIGRWFRRRWRKYRGGRVVFVGEQWGRKRRSCGRLARHEGGCVASETEDLCEDDEG